MLEEVIDWCSEVEMVKYLMLYSKVMNIGKYLRCGKSGI